MNINTIYCGNSLDVIKKIDTKSIDMCITSPPYWNLRNYESEMQLGQEENPDEYINNLCDIFNEVKRVLKENGTLWVNISDTYNKKCLQNIPSKFAIQMCDRGWKLRNEIIWYKPNAMPCSAKDRFTIDYEKLFMFSLNDKYYFVQQKEPSEDSYNGKRGSSKTRKKMQSAMRDKNIENKIYNERNIRCVWKINTEAYKGEHFATYPKKLIEIPIQAGCPVNGIILDPFIGSGTTAVSAILHNRNYIGIDVNSKYCDLSRKRIIEETTISGEQDV